MAFLSRLFGGFSKGSLSSFGKSYQLAAREPLTRNTHRFTFALEAPDSILGLPVGHHLEVRLPGGSGESRAYTPTTGDETRGSFDLAVKVYENGKVSSYLDSLKVGDEAEMAGPNGALTYKGAGAFEIADVFSGTTRTLRPGSVAMIAGGTGVTPMYQVAKHASQQEGDPLNMALLFANLSPEDIFLQEELDSLAASCPRFSIDYSVDALSSSVSAASAEAWPHHTGMVSTAMLEKVLSRLPGRPGLVCICGPPGFHRAVKEMLIEGLGYSREEVYDF